MSGDQYRLPETTQRKPPAARGSVVLGFVLLLHVSSVFVFFPPWQAWRSEPLFFTDHPVHTHRVYMYREALQESALPWGYDPAVGAGTTMPPGEDVGAKIQQVLGAVLGFLLPGQVERLVLFFAALTAPLGTLLACRRLGFSLGSQACIMAALLPVTWIVLLPYFSWGLVGFALASFLTPYILALFLDFVAEPGFKSYLTCVAGASVLFLFHVLGPVVVVPSLIFLTLGAKGLSKRWRAALVLVPVVVGLINIFWLAPLVLAEQMPEPPTNPTTMEFVTHLTASDWSDSLAEPSMDRIIRRVVAVSLGLYGLVVLYRAVGPFTFVILIGAAAFAAGLRFFGSFLPGIERMQPLRFIAPAVVLLAIPVGLALESLGQKCRLRGDRSALLVGLALLAGAFWLGEPKPLPLPPTPDALREFLPEHTTTEDRLLVQSLDGYRYRGFEAKVFPITYNREVIGNTFPQTDDPAQFHSDFLWGKALSSWRPDDLRASLERWGVTWVFVQTDEADKLLSAATGVPSVAVGGYRALKVPTASTSRFMVGRGRVAAKVNRLDLSDVEPENGIVVLRYRYHPAWRSDSGERVLRYPIPEDTKGFIALANPPRNLTLHFDPAAMLQASWPDPMPIPLSTKPDETASRAGSHTPDQR